ncbi:MAG: phosphodiester glycosidase family protein [Chloroflexota bacterium]|jgi:hypothetical protein
MKRTWSILIGVIAVVALCAGGYLLYDRGRPAPVPMKQTLYAGIIYRRIVRFVPHAMIAHVIIIDRKTANVAFLVTPPDQEGDLPLKARTTSQFLDEFNVQIAINGDGFAPWWSRSPADYYPRAGEPVAPQGFTASNGKVYSTGVLERVGTAPTLYFTRQGFPSFNRRPNKIWNAISGDRMLVTKGEPLSGLDDSALEPRTAIGINQNGRYLYLVVVDGRQPFYSAGATFRELAELLVEQGAYLAMSLDGGGSSTLVIEGEDGAPVILNSPIDNYIPGRERPVGNHFGVYVNP